MMTIRQAVQEGIRRLAPGESPELDAEVLLSHLLQRDRSYLYTWPEKILTPLQEQAYARQLDLRQQGQPVAYLCGKKAFWTFELSVTSAVLIPRPETELLVETALELLPEDALTVADLGTGSGAIALALASERKQWRVIATDISGQALVIAGNNAADLGINNVEFRQGSWCEALVGTSVQAIVSNPPYISPGDPHLEQGDVRFEPGQALVAAKQGLADIRTLVSQAKGKLAAGGWLLLEHGYNQASAVRDLLQAHGYDNINTWKDLGGNERVTGAQFKGGSDG